MRRLSLRPLLAWRALVALVAVAGGASLLGLPAATQARAANVLEKTVNLDESLRVAQILRGMGFQVVLTRTSDTGVSLASRSRMARPGDIFVSVHNNSSSGPGAHGTELYAQVAKGSSIALAQRLLSSVTSRAGTAGRGVFQRRGAHGDYYAVLRNTPTTAVIVEGAFLSNPAEAARLSTAAFRQQLAEGIAQGIGSAAIPPPSGPGPAPASGLLAGASPPAGLSATRGPGGVTLSWQPVFGASGYVVWRDGNAIAAVGGTQAVDGGAGFGAHRYHVQAVQSLLGLQIGVSPAATVTSTPQRVIIDPGHGGGDSGAVGHT